MPKCRYCHENITKLDREICPFCGGKKPFEGSEYLTQDITQTIDTISKDKIKPFKQHSKKIMALYCMFLGFFGADCFYLGFKKYGFYRIIINFVITAVLGTASLFLLPLINSSLVFDFYYHYIFAFIFLFIIYFILGITRFYTKNKKDSNGVFVR